jgi:hypothetical protein
MEGFAVNIQNRVIKTRNCEMHYLGVEVTGRCRKCDKVGEIIGHSIARCSSLSENAYLGRYNQLAKNNSPRDCYTILNRITVIF